MKYTDEEKVKLSEHFSNMKKPTVFQRFTASLIDMCLFLISFFVLGTFLSQPLISLNPTYATSAETINLNLYYSGLYVTKQEDGVNVLSQIESSEFLEENKSVVTHRYDQYLLNNISYFYLSYLTGNQLTESYDSSPDSSTNFTVDGISYLPSEYYTISWFNENVLGLPEEGKQNQSGYFEYCVDPMSSEILFNELGVLKTDGDFTEDDLVAELSTVYRNALNVFYSLPTIAKEQLNVQATLSNVFFAELLVPAVIFYGLLPLLLKDGKSIGKLIMKISVVNSYGFKASKAQILLRPIILYGLIFVVSYLSPSSLWLVVSFVILFASLTCFFFTPKNKAFHDYIASTNVVLSECDIQKQESFVIEDRTNFDE